MLDLVWLDPRAARCAGFLVLLAASAAASASPRAGWLATGAAGAAFVGRVVVFFGLLAEPAEDARSTSARSSRGCRSGGFSVDIGFLADPLSITMVLFVTGVGTLIHLYSIGYMHGDPTFSQVLRLPEPVRRSRC